MLAKIWSRSTRIFGDLARSLAQSSAPKVMPYQVPPLPVRSGAADPPYSNPRTMDDWNAYIERQKFEFEYQKSLNEYSKLRIEVHKIAVDEWKAHQATNDIMLKATIDYAKQAIALVFAMNGAAATAILTRSVFASSNDVTRQLALSLPLFAWGCCLAVSCAALSYIGQGFFTRRYDNAGTLFQISGVLAWLFSLGLFITASNRAAEAFQTDLARPAIIIPTIVGATPAQPSVPTPPPLPPIVAPAASTSAPARP